MAAEVRDTKRRRAGRRQHGRTRISSKNQVTVPVAVLREVGLEAGETVEVVAVAPGVFEVRRGASRLDGVAGMIPGLGAAVDLDTLRDEWEH